MKNKSLITQEYNQGGHRERLRNKFLKGAHAMADYELLELLLCLAIPRKDVKPLAKTLFKHLKNFDQIICSDLNILTQIQGLGINTAISIKLVHEIIQRVLKEQFKHVTLLNNQEQLINYLKIAMAYKQIEQFRVLFLNTKHVLIADEIQCEGTIDQVALYIRQIIKRALELNSSKMILVHNHPTGDAAPSQADIESTKLLQEACFTMNITLNDHIIIGRFGFFSMREHELL